VNLFFFVADVNNATLLHKSHELISNH